MNAARSAVTLNGRRSPSAFHILLWACALSIGRDARAQPTTHTAGYQTIESAVPSGRPSPIPVVAVYGADRDWHLKPFRLAVVLVDFADTKHAPVHTPAFYERLVLNGGHAPATQPSYRNLAGWYAAQSSDAFVLSGKVFDWVAIDETYHGIHGMPRKESETKYLRAALDKVRQRDGADALTGYDGLFIIHAGPIASPNTNILWSHRWVLDGMRYLTTYETESANVSCHEFGHMLGLPDLYGKPGVRQTIGPWCTMSNGYRGDLSGSLCVWSKGRLGWCRPTVIDPRTEQQLLLRPIETNPNDALLIPLNDHDGTGAEFLMLENRAGILNDAGRQAGLLIWRITRDADKDGNPTFALALLGPDDDAKPQTRQANGEQLRDTRRPAPSPQPRVAWPSPTGRDTYRLLPATGDHEGITIGNIHQAGQDVAFTVGR